MTVCIFASANNVDKVYCDAAEALGYYLGSCGHTLLYGGYAEGLMKAAADGFSRAGAPIIGVGVTQFDDQKKRHPGETEHITAADLGERKQIMMARSDMFIALPGGVGTLDEVFSVLSLKSIGGIKGDVVFYQVDGFWDPLEAMLYEMRARGFIRDDMNNAYRLAGTPEEVWK